MSDYDDDEARLFSNPNEFAGRSYTHHVYGTFRVHVRDGMYSLRELEWLLENARNTRNRLNAAMKASMVQLEEGKQV